MQNTAKVEKLVIVKIVLSTKVAVGGKKPDISIQKVWVVQQANIRPMAVNIRKVIIFWDTKKIQLYRKKVEKRFKREQF